LKQEEQVFKKAWKYYSDEPPTLVYDIGANEGFTTQYFLNMRAKRIIAIEPDPEAIKILRFRFAKSKKVHLIQVALGDKTGPFPFYQISPHSGYNTFVYDWYHKHALSDSKILEANMVRITDIFQQYGLPDLIKIDVEGTEWEIIKTIHQDIPFLCFEANLPLFASNTRFILQHLKALLPHHQLLCSSNNILSSPTSLAAAMQIVNNPMPVCVDFFFIRPKKIS
jgi:FkbM family methyltransferase